LGGVSVLSAIERNIPVIAVRENQTVMNVSTSAFEHTEQIIQVTSYYEAAGVLQALRLGLPVSRKAITQGVERLKTEGIVSVF
jgi:hypothetical protein